VVAVSFRICCGEMGNRFLVNFICVNAFCLVFSSILQLCLAGICVLVFTGHPVQQVGQTMSTEPLPRTHYCTERFWWIGLLLLRHLMIRVSFASSAIY
jgi:hypothetical protein